MKENKFSTQKLCCRMSNNTWRQRARNSDAGMTAYLFMIVDNVWILMVLFRSHYLCEEYIFMLGRKNLNEQTEGILFENSFASIIQTLIPQIFKVNYSVEDKLSIRKCIDGKKSALLQEKRLLQRPKEYEAMVHRVLLNMTAEVKQLPFV